MAMDASEVKAIVDLCINDMMDALAIPHWRLDVQYGPCEHSNWGAQCERDINYVDATITIDPMKVNKTSDVISALRHELFHVMLAHFDLVRDCLPNQHAEARVWSYALESTVVVLEKMFANMTERQFHLLKEFEYPPEKKGKKKRG